MLCVDGSRCSSYLKDYIHYGCFLHCWWTMIDLCRLFIPWSGLRLKFQDHCDFLDSVRNWMLWLERAFMACWYFEDRCWNFGRFVLADDPYAYLDAQNIHYAFFCYSVSHPYVHWIDAYLNAQNIHYAFFWNSVSRPYVHWIVAPLRGFAGLSVVVVV